MTAIPSTNGSSNRASTNASTYRVYAQQAASGQLAASASAAVAASTAPSPTEMNRRDLHATLGKNLDAAA
jgi:hypothetical protein